MSLSSLLLLLFLFFFVIADESRPLTRLPNSESWVEVASQPSSSSLSSIGDDIVTTGLRVGSSSYPPRRRRPQRQQQPMPGSFIVGHPATQAGATSSQEEYDETESEDDRVLTSSTEAVYQSVSLHRRQTAMRTVAGVGIASDSDSDAGGGGDDDDDENATALGRPSDAPVFRPQPNAFSHPPSHLSHRHSAGSAQPFHHHHHHHRHHHPSPHARHAARSHRGAPNLLSPAYQADNDAALRASLTTLLSCAAAARGLPKHDERRTAAVGGPGAGVVPSSQPIELRLVPESELMMADDVPPPPPPSAAATSRGGPGRAAAPAPVPARTASNSSAPSGPSSPLPSPPPPSGRDKSKRGAATQTQTQTRPARAAKKKRTNTSHALATGGDGAAATTTAENNNNNNNTAPTFFLSPSLLTWVVSAGVVVLVSVVGFGAGYVLGREVGRQEGGGALCAAGPSSTASNASSAAAAAAATSGCGGELVRAGSAGTLRRIRWGGAVGKGVTA